ncbi:GHKL domain protein [Shuttleworthella sp. MSX8B]|uniref:sensor histidine kinase n=1 Tax=Shuttleworthella sp. MSX8B TaxID=936574 RepID=UPI00044A3A95|nr:HAMP domain-containing sensor histidine kinase [Shuttleworthia sp. MSX8B]EUB15293.1 GHKL domain protein [Shuttleworthia sp. MSX8B]
MTSEQQTNMTIRLIAGFIVVMLVAAGLELLVVQLVNRLFVPGLILPLMEQAGIQSMTVGQSVYLFLGMIFLLLVRLLGLIFQGSLTELGDQILAAIVSHAFTGSKGMVLPHLTGGGVFLLLLVLANMIVLYALPYVITGVLYARFVIGQMRLLQEEQRKEHEKFDADRNLILSDIAHDLRNPITTVLGYARALEDGMVTDPALARRYLKAIEAKSRRVNDLINILFDYAKINSTGFHLQKRTLDINELVRENTALLFEEVEDRGMELDAQISEERWQILADRVQFSRVISNLINNASRHNPRGTRILVRTQAIRHTDRALSYDQMRRGQTQEDRIRYGLGEGILVIIADDGQPIPRELAEHMFEPFAMGDSSRSSRGGSGLGLSIAAKISQMHGYRLILDENYPGYTKAFVVVIPKHWS